MLKLILNWYRIIDASKYISVHISTFEYNFRNEYFLGDYIFNIGNFNTEFVTTGFVREGYTDLYNANYSQMSVLTELNSVRKSYGTTSGGNITYDFCIIPNVDFLGNNDPLPKNTELKLSFDRTEASIPLLSDTKQEIELVLNECYAVTEYVSSPEKRKYFESIDYEPLRYEFEECEVYSKSIPQGETNIRFDNLRGGNVPSHMFIGLIDTESLNGDYTLSSTKFSPHKVSQMNITLNGNSVNGYPIKIDHERCVLPLTKFIDCTNQIQNVNAGATLSSSEFNYNWIWSHCFEAEETSRGWIGVDFKLDAAFTKAMTMVVWVITPTCIAIDKFHQLEKINF